MYMILIDSLLASGKSKTRRLRELKVKRDSEEKKSGRSLFTLAATWSVSLSDGQSLMSKLEALAGI